MAAFEYRQAEEIRDAFDRCAVRYLFIGKSGAILLGFPDTTQESDVIIRGELRPVVAAKELTTHSEMGDNRGFSTARGENHGRK